MGKTLRGFLAIKSALVGVLVLGLWVRSYFIGDAFTKGTDSQYAELASTRGVVIVRFRHDGAPTKIISPWGHRRVNKPAELLLDAEMDQTFLNRIGFGFNYRMIRDKGMIVNIMMPHGVVFLLAIPSGAKWMIHRVKGPERRGAPMAWCPTCARELTDPVEACPECGGPVAIADPTGPLR